MSQRDVKRYELLHKVIEETLTLRQVTEALGKSYRQAKRLKAWVEAAGLRGPLHGNRGRRPHNAPAEALRARVVALSRQRYFDANDTHFTELPAAREHIVLSRETVRRWRREAGLGPTPPTHRPSTARVGPARRRRD